MLLTIQIVNYNSRDNLKTCLQSIRENVQGLEGLQVIVVNNDREELGNFLDGFGVEIIEKKENIGFGKAHNLGFEKARGEYVFFLNPDTKLFPGTVGKIAEVFSADGKIGIVGPVHVEEDKISDEEHFGPRKTPLSTIGTKIFREKEKPDAQKYFETDWVSGGAMMIRKNLFSELGGFDENYFMYFEDVDLCLQAKKRGWKIAVQPGAKIFHKSGQSFSGNREKKKYYYNSQSYYIKKNFGLLWARLVKIARFPFYVKNVWLG
jgi:GT2 family glycosyltransferase